jgi:hypothetical protein
MLVLLALIYISNKSLYLLKVRWLRQKISFPQIRSMAGIVFSDRWRRYFQFYFQLD